MVNILLCIDAHNVLEADYFLSSDYWLSFNFLTCIVSLKGATYYHAHRLFLCYSVAMKFTENDWVRWRKSA
jgi:hypothetical protein